MQHILKLEKTSHAKLAWIVTLTASLFFFYEFIQMNLFNAINVELREAFRLDAYQLGQLFSMYFCTISGYYDQKQAYKYFEAKLALITTS